MSADFEKIVQPFVADFQAENSPGGSVGIFQDGKILYEKSFGYADLEKKILNKQETNYRLASVTKQFTAMSIMILQERGLLSYDDTLDKFWPDFNEYGKTITVRHLLNHTSGLIDYEDIMPSDTTEPILDHGVLELMKKETKTYFVPGAEYKYSNSGYSLLAMIVEKVSGKSFATFLKENIFEPLGMDETIAFEKGISTVQNRAFGYDKTEEGFEFADQSMTSSVLGDGGIYCSIRDYFKWDKALYTEKLVRKETLEKAYTPAKLNDGSTYNYGFGWGLSQFKDYKIIYHGGSTTGFRNGVQRVPEVGLCVVVLMNRNDPKSEEISRGILEKILE